MRCTKRRCLLCKLSEKERASWEEEAKADKARAHREFAHYTAQQKRRAKLDKDAQARLDELQALSRVRLAAPGRQRLHAAVRRQRQLMQAMKTWWNHRRECRHAVWDGVVGFGIDESDRADLTTYLEYWMRLG